MFPVPSVKLPYSDLSLVDKIYLASLIPLGSREFLPSQIVASSNSILSPAGVLDKAIYSHLLNKAIIFPVVEKLPKNIVLNLSENALMSRQVYQANIFSNDSEALSIEDIYHHILQNDQQNAISDRTGANAKRCTKCDSANLELLESRKGIIALCLDCNNSLLLQPAIENKHLN
ncbi:hypothetical protein [Photobacterium damselae]|uniref:hypothetical protein n=1 Tax=Photobacterium damselae TaxID=38293 RepID=UPI0018A3BF5B|nr:hypothetical protein [Photobacterium damselae]QOQ68165.1 hypothetical protein IL982_10220 [Photobacterium damselae subsp. damselae]